MVTGMNEETFLSITLLTFPCVEFVGTLEAKMPIYKINARTDVILNDVDVGYHQCWVTIFPKAQRLYSNATWQCAYPIR